MLEAAQFKELLKDFLIEVVGNELGEIGEALGEAEISNVSGSNAILVSVPDGKVFRITVVEEGVVD